MDRWLLTSQWCISASRLTAGMDSSTLVTLIRNKCHIRWMEMMLRTPTRPRLTRIRLSNQHQLAAGVAEGRTCFADFQPVLSSCSPLWLILQPNTWENTLRFIHPAFRNHCLFLIRVPRVPVGTTLARSPRTPRSHLESLISQIKKEQSCKHAMYCKSNI